MWWSVVVSSEAKFIIVTLCPLYRINGCLGLSGLSRYHSLCTTVMRFVGQGPSTQDIARLWSSLPLSSLSFLPLIKDKCLPVGDPAEWPPSQLKDPLLSLTLSTPSFLECTVMDVAANYPLYQIKTSGTTTTISRRESGASFVVTSSIKWPKIIPMKRAKARPELVLVLMKDGPWRGGSSLLKPRSKENNSHKFRLPNFENPITWKLHAHQYWCTAPIAGTIAMLDTRNGILPPKLTIYEDFHDPQQPVYAGISTLLLDYLVVTALLLVTDLQDWVSAPRKNKLSSSNAEVEFRTVTSQSYREEPSYLLNRRRWEGPSQSSSSIASTIRSGATAPNPPAGYSLSISKTPHSWLDTDSDSESEHESRTMPRRTSLHGPVSETHFPTAESYGSQLHHPRNLRTPLATADAGQVQPPRSVSENFIEDSRQMAPASASSSPHPIHHPATVDSDDEDGLPNDPSTRPHVVNNVRPLPHLPIACSSIMATPGTDQELDAPSLPSQNGSGRNLPRIPDESRRPSAAPDAVNNDYPRTPSDLSSHTRSVHPRGSIYRQQRVTKALQEDITQWLNALTGDPSSTENTQESLVRASIFGTPPPPYHSLRISSANGREPVPVSDFAGASD